MTISAPKYNERGERVELKPLPMPSKFEVIREAIADDFKCLFRFFNRKK